MNYRNKHFKAWYGSFSVLTQTDAEMLNVDLFTHIWKATGVWGKEGSELIYFALLTTALSEGQLRFQVAEVENFSECTTAQSSSDDLGRQEIKSGCTARELLQHPLTGHRHFWSLVHNGPTSVPRVLSYMLSCPVRVTCVTSVSGEVVLPSCLCNTSVGSTSANWGRQRAVCSSSRIPTHGGSSIGAGGAVAVGAHAGDARHFVNRRLISWNALQTLEEASVMELIALLWSQANDPLMCWLWHSKTALCVCLLSNFKQHV